MAGCEILQLRSIMRLFLINLIHSTDSGQTKCVTATQAVKSLLFYNQGKKFFNRRVGSSWGPQAIINAGTRFAASAWQFCVIVSLGFHRKEWELGVIDKLAKIFTQHNKIKKDTQNRHSHRIFVIGKAGGGLYRKWWARFCLLCRIACS